jgi:hypothetical protein
METSLHRQLKQLYAGPDARTEVRFGRYRIDVVAAGRLIEVQHGRLAAIRDKVRALLRTHEVTVVKPIIASKLILHCESRGARPTRKRLSPKRGTPLGAFDELLYFTRVFPHGRLRLDFVLVDIEELRYPGHGRRRRWRRDDYQIEDQRLVKLGACYSLRQASDLKGLLPGIDLPGRFHTGQLAEALAVHRWVAQRIAYCLRQCGATRVVGKSRGSLLYEWADDASPRSRRRAA